jgi:hypothetical protein
MCYMFLEYFLQNYIYSYDLRSGEHVQLPFTRWSVPVTFRRLKIVKTRGRKNDICLIAAMLVQVGP